MKAWRRCMMAAVVVGVLSVAILGLRVDTALAETHYVSLPYSSVDSVAYSWDDDDYQFSARAGDMIEVEVAAPGEYHVEVGLYAPGGFYPSDSDTTLLGPARLFHTAEISGTWEIRVEPGLMQLTPFAYSISADFFYRPPVAPTVASVSPSYGPTSGGAVVNVSGTGFTTVSYVKFGTGYAWDFTVNSSTSITATTPAHSAGRVDVVVVAASGSSATAGIGDDYYYDASLPPVPYIDALSPNTGPTTGGNLVTLHGAGFAGATSVKFGGTASGSVRVISDYEMTAVAPSHPAGVVDVTVTGPGGTNPPSVSGNRYTYAALPTISALSVHTGPTTGGTAVTITGTNLAGATAVKFGSTSTPILTKSATTITVKSPARLSGACYVTVTTPAGTSATGAASAFTYTLAKYQENSTLLSYSTAWTQSGSSSNYSSSYIRTRTGSSAPLTFTFTGVGFKIISAKGPSYGKLKVTIDGTPLATTAYPDLYASSTSTARYQQTVYTKTGLTNTSHTVVLDYSGLKNGSSSGYTVNLDALLIDGTLTAAYSRYQENNTRIYYPYLWAVPTANSLYSGSYIRTRSSAGALTFKFTGTGFRVIATKGSSWGKMKITIDGGTSTLYDLYAGSTLYQQVILSKTGLTYGTHTVKLDYGAAKNPLSSLMRVNLDAVDIYGTLLQAP